MENKMDKEQLRKEIEEDEGCKYEIYKDHLGVQLILCNMMFNMGRPRLSKFKKMNEAITNEDWIEASVQMEDSRWYNQVTNRAKRLVERMAQVQVFPHG